MHPEDARAKAALERIPALGAITKKVLEVGFERALYLENVADNVRVDERMFPRLNRYLQWSCRILGVDVPEMYVTMDPVPNAYTYGHTRPFIVLSSGLLDLLDPEEQFFVVAHEVGHIKCEHMLYTVLARNLAALIDAVGQATLGIGALLGTGLALPLYDWYRKSELSADRAALLALQDPALPVRVFMKLAGGSRPLVEEMDEDAFRDQIRLYEDEAPTGLDKVYKFLLTAFRTHPFPILRAKHLDAWIESGGYAALIGRFGGDEAVSDTSEPDGP
ncbi:MAG: M48 family peptidase [Deltaproteobacteria bacterium]|nr:MAG: M48 family peptidase [Deltaproteobacteria bacterium]